MFDFRSLFIGLLFTLGVLILSFVSSSAFGECGGPLGALNVWHDFGVIRMVAEEKSTNTEGDICILMMMLFYLTFISFVFCGYFIFGMVARFLTHNE